MPIHARERPFSSSFVSGWFVLWGRDGLGARTVDGSHEGAAGGSTKVRVRREFRGLGEGMVTEGPIGERIRIYRRRRGLSQRELAGLVGRSESWLSQVERGIRSVDQLSVLIDIARVLKTDIETLAGYQMAYAPNGQPDLDALEDIRAALSAYPGLAISDVASGNLQEVEELTTEVHQRYQAATTAPLRDSSRDSSRQATPRSKKARRVIFAGL